MTNEDKGDAKFCEICKAHTVYGDYCTVHGLTTQEMRKRYSGQYWMKND